MKTVNQLKEKALQILLDETFACVDKSIYRAHAEIAKKNAELRKGSCNFFLFGGEIYPKQMPNGSPITGLKLRALPLHYSLIEDLDQINTLRDKHDFTAIKNYFSAVLSHSFNNIVLDTLLPSVLVNRLRKDLSEEAFKAINRGAWSFEKDPPESVGTTQENLARIQEHYQNTITQLRYLLMDNLLLQE